MLQTCCYSVELRMGCVILGGIFLLVSIGQIYQLFVENERTKKIPRAAKLTISIISFTYVPIVILLLVGIIKQIPWMMLPWLVLFLLYQILNFCFVLIAVPDFFVAIVFGVLSRALEVYFWFVILSYYLELRDNAY